MSADDKVTLAKDEYDRVMGSLSQRNDCVATRESVIRHIPTWGIGGGVKTFIVQTIRASDGEGGSGDFVFIECSSSEGMVRLVLTPEVAAAIARQRDALSTKNRRNSARASMRERMQAGYVPTFAKPRKK